MLRRISLIITLCICVAAPSAFAQGGSAAITHAIRLRDGSTMMGKLISRDSVTIRFETNGAILSIPAANVLEIRAVTQNEMHDGEYWFPDPNRTRLFFAPTGRMLDAGEGYYSNTYLLLQNFVGGVSDRVTMGGGFSIVPSNNFLSNNAYYLTPKVGIYNSPETNAAVGALVGYIPAGNGTTFGVLYSVLTQGGPDGSMTGGLGYGFSNGTLSSRPVFMIGGEKRLSRRIAFVSENYGIYTSTTHTSCAATCTSVESATFNAAYSAGLRFMGEKLSTDLAIWNTGDSGVFPGIPYVAFAIKW